jgi:hypothetical protein
LAVVLIVGVFFAMSHFSSNHQHEYGIKDTIEEPADLIYEARDTILNINGEIFKYTGTMKNGVPDGILGRAEFIDDVIMQRNTYNGGWKNGKREGKGTLRYKNRDKYEGDFADNTFNGCGIVTYASGASYKGQFVDGKRKGLGIYCSATGKTEMGEWDKVIIRHMSKVDFDALFDSVCVSQDGN